MIQSEWYEQIDLLALLGLEDGSACIRKGTVSGIYPHTDFIDVDLDDTVTFLTNIPIFYHCQGQTLTLGGRRAFSTLDTVIVLEHNYIDSEDNPQLDYYCIGFQDKPKYCQKSILELIIVNEVGTKLVGYWDIDNRAPAQFRYGDTLFHTWPIEYETPDLLAWRSATPRTEIITDIAKVDQENYSAGVTRNDDGLASNMHFMTNSQAVNHRDHIPLACYCCGERLGFQPLQGLVDPNRHYHNFRAPYGMGEADLVNEITNINTSVETDMGSYSIWDVHYDIERNFVLGIDSYHYDHYWTADHDTAPPPAGALGRRPIWYNRDYRFWSYDDRYAVSATTGHSNYLCRLEWSTTGVNCYSACGAAMEHLLDGELVSTANIDQFNMFSTEGMNIRFDTSISGPSSFNSIDGHLIRSNPAQVGQFLTNLSWCCHNGTLLEQTNEGYTYPHNEYYIHPKDDPELYITHEVFYRIDSYIDTFANENNTFTDSDPTWCTKFDESYITATVTCKTFGQLWTGTSSFTTGKGKILPGISWIDVESTGFVGMYGGAFLDWLEPTDAYTWQIRFVNRKPVDYKRITEAFVDTVHTTTIGLYTCEVWAYELDPRNAEPLVYTRNANLEAFIASIMTSEVSYTELRSSGSIVVNLIKTSY